MKRLTCGLLVVGALSACMGAQPVKGKTLLEALEGVTVEGMLGYAYHDREIEGGKRSKQSEPNIRFGIHVPISENINAVVAVEGYQPLGVHHVGDSVVKFDADVRNAYFEYFDNKFKFSAGQQPLNIPIADNGSQGLVGMGARIDYKIGETNLVAASFAGADDLSAFPPAFVDPFLHGYWANYNLPDGADSSSILFVGAEHKFKYVNTEFWAIKSPGFLKHMFVGLANGQVDNFNYAIQVINTKVNNTNESGTHYLVKLGYEMGPVHATIQHSKNDDKQGIYSFSGEDSSGLEKTGIRLGTMIDNVPGVEVYSGSLGMYVGDKTDVKLHYGKADINGLYAGRSIDDTFTEYGASIEHMILEDLLTGIYYSDITSDDIFDQKYFGFKFGYFF